MVHERKGEGCHGQSWAVCHFADKEKIANQQGLFHGWCGNGVSFDQEGADDGGGNNSKNNGVDPLPDPGFLDLRPLFRINILFLFAKTKIGQVGKRKDHSQGLFAQSKLVEAFDQLDDHEQDREYIDERD